MYARSLGMRVVRLLSVSEGGANYPRPPMPYASDIMVTGARVAKTEIDPGSQDLEVTLAMSFELQ